MAVYSVDPDDLEGAPRVVACSACLHEWNAAEVDFIWGHDEAKSVLEAAAEKMEAGGSAFASARGVEVSRQSSRQFKRESEKKVENLQGDGRSRRIVNSGSSVSEDDDRFNVFVGNLSFRATAEDLYRAFSGYGAVLKCEVPADPSGASKGYGFVEMRTRESAMRAIEELQGASILGRDISLNVARPKRDLSHPRRGNRRSRRGQVNDESRRGQMNGESRRVQINDGSRRGEGRNREKGRGSERAQ